ncbi:MAG: hypothetical protein ACKOOF_11070 [Planctomycetaceae bacterium]
MATSAAERIEIEPVSAEAVRSLMEPHQPPCLSLFLPTHRTVPDNRVDRPAYRHLVEALELALSVSKPRDEIERLLAPFRLLADDVGVWEHVRDGLAVFGSDGRARAFLLQRPVAPLAVVTRRFHTMPLVRAVMACDRFNVLALTSRSARVYEGTAWHDPHGTTADLLDPVSLVPLPGRSARTDLTRGDVIDEETFQPHRVQHGMGPAGLGTGGVVHGGFGAKRDDVDADTEIFLRHVDDRVRDEVSRRSGLPLVLVAGARLAAMFRGLSKNDLLIDEPVAKDPHLMPVGDLAADVAAVFRRAHVNLIRRQVRAFTQARDRGLAASDLADIARAAVAGQVATLLVEADRFEAGRLDRDTGAIEFDGGPPPDLSRTGDRAAVRADDLFGGVAETVLLHGGDVLALGRNDMPTETGVAAIYRYA